MSQIHKKQQFKIIATTGLALFAMFFGAGNVVFPLSIGATSGEHIWFTLATFLIAGVCLPFLGVFAILLYEGDYWRFFTPLGKIPAFLAVTFIILIIGPLFAAPRTEIVTYATFLPFLPGILANKMVFSFLYFAIVFFIVFNQSRIIDFIGWFISPIKLTMFFTLIVTGIISAETESSIHAPTLSEATLNALHLGYSTMDLLGAFFFCTVAYTNIINKCQTHGASKERIAEIALKSCLMGAFFISLVYSGLIFSAYSHANALIGVPAEDLLSKISFIVLGKFCSFFICICALFACLATASALAVVSSDYFYKTIFREKIPKKITAIFILAWMFFMSLIGFEGILNIALPILNVLYPLLILLCIYNIFVQLRKKEYFAFSKANSKIS